MTLSDQHPRIFICSTTHYGAFPHTFFFSDALLLKNETLNPTQRLKFLAPTIIIKQRRFLTIFLIKQINKFTIQIYIYLFVFFLNPDLSFSLSPSLVSVFNWLGNGRVGFLFLFFRWGGMSHLLF